MREKRNFNCWIAGGLVALACVLGWSGRASAASGASFLKIPTGARSVAMGNAYTAIANDVTALHWNPGGLQGITRKELSMMHAELFADTRYDFVGFAMPLGQAILRAPTAAGERGAAMESPWAAGFSAVYLSHGAIDGRDDSGNKNGSFTASDFSFSLGLAHRMTRRTSAGASLKMIRENIASESASGFAVDLGLVSRTPRLNLGLAIQNVGPSMKFGSSHYNLPLTISAGAGYTIGGGVTLSADYRHRPIDNVSSLGFGGELSLLSSFSLRAGYLSNLTALQKTQDAKSSFADQLSGLGMGFGLKLFRSQLDYAMTPMGELGISQRLSLTVRF